MTLHDLTGALKITGVPEATAEQTRTEAKENTGVKFRRFIGGKTKETVSCDGDGTVNVEIDRDVFDENGNYLGVHHTVIPWDVVAQYANRTTGKPISPENVKLAGIDFEAEMDSLFTRLCAPSKIRGGPGNPTVNAFEPTYCNHAEMRVRTFLEGRTE